MEFQNINKLKKVINDCQAVFVIAGAGTSVDSGIFTYRGKEGLWEKSIKVGNEMYRYSDISSLEMWKKNPEIAWDLRLIFIK